MAGSRGVPGDEGQPGLPGGGGEDGDVVRSMITIVAAFTRDTRRLHGRPHAEYTQPVCGAQIAT